MMEADRLLEERLQAREREELTIKEKSKLFVELMNKRRKHFADLRAQEKRNKPPTKSQKRSQMSTYLKNMGTWKHSQLKSKTYEEIKRLFKLEMKRVNTFITMIQDEEGSKKDKDESNFKRACEELESDVSKKCLEVVYEDEDDVTIDATSLSSRSPSIVNYKIHKENFNTDDLEDLWKIVKSRFMKKDPVDDLDNLLLRVRGSDKEASRMMTWRIVVGGSEE
ncbi:hypothetical protein Tco_0245867 [Tanacetum coccineum]